MSRITERLKGLAGPFGLARLAGGLADAGRLDAGSSQWQALWAGFLGCLSVPGLILFCSAAGYGALARDSGFSLFNAAFMMAVLYALPAQVVVIDQLARGASIWAGAFSVLLTAVRMLPMTVTIMPYLTEGNARGQSWRKVLAVHFVAVTSWIEGMRRLPAVPGNLRLSYFIGLGFGLMSAAVGGTVVGFELSGAVPQVISAMLLFLTPIYFFLSQIKTAHDVADWAAIGLGCVLGPMFYVMFPEFDLLLSALVGGTAAFLIGRSRVWGSGPDDPDEDAGDSAGGMPGFGSGQRAGLYPFADGEVRGER